MGKSAGSVSIIGGADGPTSYFIAGKGGKVKFTTRIRNALYRIKRNRIKRRIRANPHTLEEVVAMLKRNYAAKEVSEQSHDYLEQKRSLKASLVMRRRPDLPGEWMDLRMPERMLEGEDTEAFKAFFAQIEERNRLAEEIADDIFPMDFHLYEIRCHGNGFMRIAVETVWQVIDGSFCGDRKSMKRLRKLYREICLYYGVTAGDIENETRRYQSLLTVLCS